MACDNTPDPGSNLKPVVYDPVTRKIRPLAFGEALPTAECDPCGAIRDFAIPPKALQDSYFDLYMRLKALEEKYCNCICTDTPCPEPEPCPECVGCAVTAKLWKVVMHYTGEPDPGITFIDPYYSQDFPAGSSDVDYVVIATNPPGPLPAGYEFIVSDNCNEYNPSCPATSVIEYSEADGGYKFTSTDPTGSFIGGWGVKYQIKLVNTATETVCSFMFIENTGY